MSFLFSSRFLIRAVALDSIRGCNICKRSFSTAVRPRNFFAAIANQHFENNGAKNSTQTLFVRTLTGSAAKRLEENNKDFYEKQIEKRLIILGKSAVVSCLTEHFLDMYPNVDALKIANLVSHVTKEILPFKMDIGVPQSEGISVRRAKMYAEIGKNLSENGKEFTIDQIKKYINKRYSNPEIEIYNKLAHPAPFLRSIALKLGKQLEVRKKGPKKVQVFVDESLVADVKASTYEKAEYEACLAVIKEKFMDEVGKISLEAEDEVLIREFKGMFDGQRSVELTKGDNEAYGIYLKGGEKATKQTEKFWQFNYIEPIFINKILEGSPADKSGRLQEGDVILAVGDFALNGVTLKSAISMINEENDVILTVKYDPEVKIRNKIKEQFIAMENKAFKETLKSDKWRKWHEAQAEKSPDKYLKVK